MNRSKILASLLLLLGCFCNSALADPETGWWWNPNESGRGFFVESQNGVTFVGAYFYDADGHAKWLVAGGQNADPNNYTGPLYELSGGQTLFGGFVAPSAPSSVGNVTVHFDDETHGTWTWPGGAIPIERQIFGGQGAPFQPFSGWWWNPSESGTGYSVEIQGNYLFLVGFMYDDAGRQVWYFSAGPMSSPSSYHGTVLQFANGQTMGGAYQPPSAPATVATLDLEFTAMNKATLTFSSSPSAADRLLTRGAATRSDNIVTEFFKNSSYEPANFYVGDMFQHIDLSDTITLAGVSVVVSGFIEVDGTDLVWQRNGEDFTSVENLDTVKYLLRGGNFSVNASLNSTVQGLGCTISMSGSTPVSYPFTSSASLTVDNYTHFDLKLFVPNPPTLQLKTITNCPNGTVLKDFLGPFLFLAVPEIQGVVARWSFVGDPTINTIRSVAGHYAESSLFPVGNGSYNLSFNFQFFETDQCEQMNSQFCPPPQP